MSERITTKHDIQRDELNITRPGFSDITNLIVSGSMSMASSGVNPGTGQVILFGNGIPWDGWIPASGTWTCFSTDSPIFNVSINTNVTGTISVGNRVQVNQSGQNKYFIIHGIGVTGSTSYLNLYGGTDYTLSSGTLSSPYYSPVKEPFGFIASPTKWMASLYDTSDQTQASPVGGTIYNPGGISLNIPIGLWDVCMEALVNLTITLGAVSSVAVQHGLSTSQSSFSEQKLRAIFRSSLPAVTGGLIGNTMIVQYKGLSISSKTTYYPVVATGVTATTIGLYGSQTTTKVEVVSSYL